MPALSREQQRVFDRLVDGENVFITGNAGTGKSFLLKAYDEWCLENKRMLVKTAPTGVAAMEIAGATIHKQFGFRIGLDFRPPNRFPDWLMSCDALLIDEISMLRIDLFDRIMQTVILANKRRKKPVQIILCGDFFQLAPVITEQERPYLKEHYGTDIGDGFCFQSKYWRSYNIRMCRMTEIHRQKNAEFCKVLDSIKVGDSSVEVLNYLRNSISPVVMNDAVWLCGKNATADSINKMHLDTLSGNLFRSSAEYKGEATKNDKLCEDEFMFKVGAKVILLVNDKEGRYQNGSRATILSANSEEITVCLEEKEYAPRNSREVVSIKRHEFPLYKYELKDKRLSLSVIGKAYQFPMKLGYAVTIHKSQGQTFDRMNLMPEIFANGQLYVALSRCRYIHTIYIKSAANSFPVTPRMVMTSQEVLSYYNDPDNYHFFDEESEFISMTVPKKYRERIEEMIQKWDEEENEAEQLGYYPIKEQKKKKKEKPADTNQLSMFDLIDTGVSKAASGDITVLADDAVPF